MIKVVIEIKGGMVTQIVTNTTGIDVSVIDHDSKVPSNQKYHPEVMDDDALAQHAKSISKDVEAAGGLNDDCPEEPDDATEEL